MIKSRPAMNRKDAPVDLASMVAKSSSLRSNLEEGHPESTWAYTLPGSQVTKTVGNYTILEKEPMTHGV